MKKGNIVRYKPEDLPQPSPEQLDQINTIKDAEIDFSDIPELDADWFKTAQVGPPLSRKAISLRVDPKVLNWFKTRSSGKRYQTYINAVLKAYERPMSIPKSPKETDAVEKQMLARLPLRFYFF